MSRLPATADVLGTKISVAAIEEVVRHVLSPPVEGLSVAIVNVHSVMTARRTQDLRDALGAVDVAAADGMPIVWALKALGHLGQSRVTGIDVMERVLDEGRTRGTRHFFYGSTEAVLKSLIGNIEARFPGVSVAGSLAPPFAPVGDDELARHLSTVKRSGADVVWVALGMPKQELIMRRMMPMLPGTAVVAVGAAFDWLAGSSKRAPVWMQRSGLEWLYRLVHEPRRLWRRYVWNNPLYLVLLGKMLLVRWLRRGA